MAAYLQYKTTQSPDDHQASKRIRNVSNMLVRQVKNKHWEYFSKRMESYFCGLPKQIWRLIRNQKKEAQQLIGQRKGLVNKNFLSHDSCRIEAQQYLYWKKATKNSPLPVDWLIFSTPLIKAAKILANQIYE